MENNPVKRYRNDQELVAAMRAGDESALKTCYALYAQGIRSWLIKKGARLDISMDLIQNTFLALWQNVQKPGFILTCKMRTYLTHIAYHQLLKCLEKEKRYKYADDRILAYTHTDYSTYKEVGNEQDLPADLVSKLLENLPEHHKKLLRYYYYDELTQDEIAKRIGFKNADTVKNTKCKIMKILRTKLINEHQEYMHEIDYLAVKKIA